MPSRSPLLLALLCACYSPTSVPDTGAAAGEDPSGGTIWGGGSGSGADGSGGGTASERGVLTDDDFTIFWRWYGNADWDNGTCTEVLLRNDGDAGRTWTLTLGLDAAISDFTHEAGAFFITDGPTLIANPVTSPGIAAGGSVAMSWCAEPRAAILSADVVSTRSSTDDGGDDGDDGDSDTDTDTPSSPILWSGETALSDVWFYARTVSEGTCTELRLRNEGSATWTIEETTLRFPEPVEMTDFWEFPVQVDEETVSVSWPGYLGDLEPGEEFKGTVCFDPVVAPVSVDVAGFQPAG
jgi:hypothetical protein